MPAFDAKHFYEALIGVCNWRDLFNEQNFSVKKKQNYISFIEPAEMFHFLKLSHALL